MTIQLLHAATSAQELSELCATKGLIIDVTSLDLARLPPRVAANLITHATSFDAPQLRESGDIHARNATSFAVPQLQFYISPAMLLLMALMALDGVILGRKVARRVDEKFPDNTESRWKIGLYAASRASQMRRMRTPRPQVKHGASGD